MIYNALKAMAQFCMFFKIIKIPHNVVTISCVQNCNPDHLYRLVNSCKFHYKLFISFWFVTHSFAQITAVYPYNVLIGFPSQFCRMFTPITAVVPEFQNKVGCWYPASLEESPQKHAKQTKRTVRNFHIKRKNCQKKLNMLFSIGNLQTQPVTNVLGLYWRLVFVNSRGSVFPVIRSL